MDPLSVLASVTSLVGAALKGIQAIDRYCDLFSRAAITIASMTAQCSCVEFALLQVQEVVLRNPQSAYRLQSDSTIANHFSSVFGACEIVFSVLNQNLKELVDTGRDNHGAMGKRARIKQVWRDQEMKDLVRNIESQASAINLLLGALQMRSNAEIRDLLSHRDSQRLLDGVSGDAASLQSGEKEKVPTHNVENISPDLCSTFDDTEFSFDFELVNTITYRRAFYNMSRRREGNSESVQNAPSLRQNETKSSEDIVFPEPEDVTEEQISEGAQTLTEIKGSKSVQEDLIDMMIRKPDHNLGNFAATSHQTSINVPRSHRFEVAELVTPSPENIEHIYTCGQPQGFSEDGTLDKSTASFRLPVTPGPSLDSKEIKLLFSKVAIVKPPTVCSELEDMTVELGTDLVDLSLPENSETRIMDISPTFKDLLELEDQSGLAVSEDAEWHTCIEEQHNTELHLNLQGFIDYLSKRKTVDPLLQATRSNSKDMNSLTLLEEGSFMKQPGKHMFSIDPITRTMQTFSISEYQLEELLHSSTSSMVLKARRKNSCEMFAIKVLSRESPGRPLRGKSRLDAIRFEVAVLQDLSHYNIIDVRELIELEMHILLVMPHLSPCTFLKYIQIQRKGTGVWCFPEQMAWHIFVQLISGVEYLHHNLTVHRNLTLESILFDEQTWRVIISGFSIAEIVPRSTESMATDEYKIRQKYSSRRSFVNPYFTAPEGLQRANKTGLYTLGTIEIEGKADIYSCGVILFAILNGVLPYSGNMLMTQFGPFHAQDHLNRLVKTPLSQAMNIHKGDHSTYHLIMSLLAFERRSRLSIHEVKNHVWMREYPGHKSNTSLIRRKPVGG